MSEVNYEKLKKSLERLKEQYKNFLLLDEKNLFRIDEEAVKESVIQRFETCYDSFFKSLRKHLKAAGFNFDSTAPKFILRKAHEGGVIDQETLKNWFNYINLRVGTTHDYNEEKVEQALSKMHEFIEDVEDIYKIITQPEQ